MSTSTLPPRPLRPRRTSRSTISSQLRKQGYNDLVTVVCSCARGRGRTLGIVALWGRELPLGTDVGMRDGIADRPIVTWRRPAVGEPHLYGIARGGQRIGGVDRPGHVYTASGPFGPEAQVSLRCRSCKSTVVTSAKAALKASVNGTVVLTPST